MNRDIVCIGGSAGGLPPLRDLASALPADLPAAVFVVTHMGADNPGVLASLLQAKSRLRVEMPADGQPIAHGRVYVARPDFHLLVKRDRIGVVRGPRENGFRPAVDPLFRTAARAYGARAIGIVLSGGLDDGAAGLLAIRRAGGTTIVQDPEDAQVPQMPLNALAQLEPDFVLETRSMAATVVDLCREPLRNFAPPADDDCADPAEFIADALRTGAFNRPASPFSCPECEGVLWERAGEGGYRCHVGHGFTPQSLLAAKDMTLERALWTSLRILEENVALRRRMVDRVERHFPGLVERYRADADEAERHADVVRKLLRKDDAATVRAEAAPATRPQGRARASARSPSRNRSRRKAASERVGE